MVVPSRSVSRSDEGFQSAQLQAALRAALAGQPAELERLLMRSGAVVTTRPNLRLAAAFGAEVAGLSSAVLGLLQRFSADDAAPDTDRAFLPIAAAHGWAARVRAGRDVQAAWAALGALAADERTPVRLGTRDALATLAQRPGGGDEVIARATVWLDEEDREQRYGAAALVIDLLGDRRLLAGIQDEGALREYLSRGIAEVAEAPRSAERSEARRRLLAALPRTLAGTVGRGGNVAQDWFQEECAAAVDVHVRRALSDVLVLLHESDYGMSSALVDDLRRSLQASAKPLRDPTRLRPGTGRGKRSRRTR
jgi:hypothetical protein